MQELLEKKLLKVTEDEKNISLASQTFNNSQSPKERLDQLLGPINFNYKLEKVNLTIGIIVSSMLLLFFFI
jgi:hypothetical protein